MCFSQVEVPLCHTSKSFSALYKETTRKLAPERNPRVVECRHGAIVGLFQKDKTVNQSGVENKQGIAMQQVID